MVRSSTMLHSLNDIDIKHIPPGSDNKYPLKIGLNGKKLNASKVRVAVEKYADTHPGRLSVHHNFLAQTILNIDCHNR